MVSVDDTSRLCKVNVRLVRTFYCTQVFHCLLDPKIWMANTSIISRSTRQKRSFEAGKT